MKMLGAGLVVIFAMTGCGIADDSLYDQCSVYDAGGTSMMECPRSLFEVDALDRNPGKNMPVEALEQALLGCPDSVCTKKNCWDLCDQGVNVCVFRIVEMTTMRRGSQPKSLPERAIGG